MSATATYPSAASGTALAGKPPATGDGGGAFAEAQYYASTSAPPLRRLQLPYTLAWLALAAAFYFWCWPYLLARALAPPAVKSYFYLLESTLESWLGGLVRNARGMVYHLLLLADDQADRLLLWAQRANADNWVHFQLAREAYLQYVEGVAGAVRREGLAGLAALWRGPGPAGGRPLAKAR